MRSKIQTEELPPAMGKLISQQRSHLLDGYVEDENGGFDSAARGKRCSPSSTTSNDRIGIYLYGRRMYETMAGWETEEFLGDRQPLMLDFAGNSRATDEGVFSRNLGDGIQRKNQDRGDLRPRR